MPKRAWRICLAKFPWDETLNPLRSILLALLVATPSLASAQTVSFESAATLLGASCGADIDTNCRGVNLDPTRLRECLSRNQDVVSPLCKADYVRAFDAIQKRVAARAAVPKLCDRDALKLCGGAPKVDGKALECLSAAPRGISFRCTQALGNAGYRQ
jgi:hypothetical protein